jgi:hypothetical protein
MEYEVNKKRGPVLWSQDDQLWIELLYYVEETKQYIAVERTATGTRLVRGDFVIIEGEDIKDFKPIPCDECGILSSIEASVGLSFEKHVMVGESKILCNDCKKKLGYKRMNEI